MSKNCILILNSIVNEAAEAGRLAHYAKRDTNRYLQAAARLVLPSELAKPGVSDASRSVTKFSSNFQF
jgi:hypothetical protein